MRTSKPILFIIATFAPMLALQLALPAVAKSPADKPVISADIPADPRGPVFLRLSSGGYTYRLVFDTGANDLFIDLARAQRDLPPAPASEQHATQAKGLHGQLNLQYFQSEPFGMGDWQFQHADSVLAADLSVLVRDYGGDGVIGHGYLSQLDWHWDNRARKLLGFPHGSATLAAVEARLRCVPLLDVNGMPGLALRIGSDEPLFVLDTGDMGESGNLSTNDLGALQDRGAIQDSVTIDRQSDIAGHPLPPLRISQIRNVKLGQLQLDGLTFGEVPSASRLGRAFMSKFDEVVLDFEHGTFCHSDIDRVEPDDMSFWRAR